MKKNFSEILQYLILLLVLCMLILISVTSIDVGPEETFTILDNASINATFGPSSTGGHTYTQSIPNGMCMCFSIHSMYMHQSILCT